MIAAPLRGGEDELLASVRARLDADHEVRALGRYEVAVADGRATLVGHVRSRAVAESMIAAAGEVRGVSRVEARLIADDELERLVADAIGPAAGGGAARLVVLARFGRVRIAGLYRSPAARSDVLRAAASVPGVLGAQPVPTSQLARR